MAPPPGPLNLDVEAISGICGSISIACWVVVFSPQIIENFRRGSADGLSLQFVIVWLLGDVFNILGAVLQGVLPTMIILAIYYTIADMVLLGQCFYYRGLTWKDEVVKPKPVIKSQAASADLVNERTGLLEAQITDEHTHDSLVADRRASDWSAQLNPTNPFNPESASTPPAPKPSVLQAIAFNALAVVMVVAAGVAGYMLSQQSSPSKSASDSDRKHAAPEPIQFDFWGQIFGWLCAILYLGSRIPQMLLNWRRKSTEGVSILFFLFACLGNLTYVLSIFAYETRCGSDSSPRHGHHGGHLTDCQPGDASHEYQRYILVNLSWLAGSLGTLILDMGIFVQFFLYRHASQG